MDNNKKSSSMWWMMLPCLAIFLLFAFAGGSGVSQSWPFLLVIGVAVVACAWMMFRGHGSHNDEHAGHKQNAIPESPTHEEKNHSCCH